MPRKASTPWSVRTVSEGGTDSPVGNLVPTPDILQPVVDTGFIALSGKFTGYPADDLQFTFQDPNQAIAADAEISIEPINMLKHDMLILALLDSSGNSINTSLRWANTGTPSPRTPYDIPEFSGTGVNEGIFKVNEYPGSSGAGGVLDNIFFDTGEGITATWTFIKLIGMRGTVGKLIVKNIESSDAGTFSSAYLRLI